MQISSKQSLNVIIAWFVVSSWLLFPSPVRPQGAFDQARQIYKAWADAQQRKQELSGAELKKVREITTSASQDVPRLLRTGILELLNSPGVHSPQQVQQRVTAVLQVAVLNEYEVFVFGLGAKQAAYYLIAYNVPYCASCSHAWIGLIGEESGRYRILSEPDDSFDDKSLHVAALSRSGGAKERFLIYGTNWGDAHSRLTAIAYLVDDGKLRRFWARTDLPQGSVRVTPTQISLTFLTALRPPWSERTEVYDVLPENIELRQSFERRNP